MPKVIAGSTSYCDPVSMHHLIDALKDSSICISEFVLVDNSPQAQFSDNIVLQNQMFPVKYIHRSDNPGLGWALNAIVQHAIHCNADFVWLFDQDSVPDSQSLQCLLNAFDISPSACVCAPRSLCAATGTELEAFRWESGQLVPAGNWIESERKVDAVITAGMLVRTAHVVTVRPCVELFLDIVDFDWCVRMRDAGFEIVQVFKAQMKHGLGNPRFVSLFGKSIFIPNYSSLRWYYYTRNLFWLEWSRSKSIFEKLRSVFRCCVRLKTVLKDDLFCMTFPKKTLSALHGWSKWSQIFIEK